MPLLLVLAAVPAAELVVVLALVLVLVVEPVGSVAWRFVWVVPLLVVVVVEQ